MWRQSNAKARPQSGPYDGPKCRRDPRAPRVFQSASLVSRAVSPSLCDCGSAGTRRQQACRERTLARFPGRRPRLGFGDPRLRVPSARGRRRLHRLRRQRCGSRGRPAAMPPRGGRRGLLSSCATASATTSPACSSTTCAGPSHGSSADPPHPRTPPTPPLFATRRAPRARAGAPRGRAATARRRRARPATRHRRPRGRSAPPRRARRSGGSLPGASTAATSWVTRPSGNAASSSMRSSGGSARSRVGSRLAISTS